MREGRFLSIARKRQRAIDTLDFPIQAPGFKLVYGALEQRIRLLGAEPFRLQGLVGAGGGLVEPIGSVVGQGLEDRSIDGKLDLVTIDRLIHSLSPGFSLHHHEQE